jgi:predicted RNA-binding Zn-ribbon protein involved in translation (DUF1610 family)
MIKQTFQLLHETGLDLALMVVLAIQLFLMLVHKSLAIKCPECGATMIKKYYEPHYLFECSKCKAVLPW